MDLHTKSYRFNVVSSVNSFISWIIITIVFFLLVVFFKFPPNGIIVSMVFAAILMLFIKNTSTAQTEWTIDKSGLNIVWLSQYYFIKQKEKFFAWDDIIDFEMFTERSWRGISFLLNTDKTVKFYYSPSADDDFAGFVDDFTAMFSEIQYHRPPYGVISDEEFKQWKEKNSK